MRVLCMCRVSIGTRNGSSAVMGLQSRTGKQAGSQVVRQWLVFFQCKVVLNDDQLE